MHTPSLVISPIAKQTKRLLQKNPSHTNQCFLHAISLHEKGELAQAEILYRKILTDEPQHADSLHMLGLILANREEHATAIDLMSQAIAIYPQFALYYANRAALYQRLNHHPKAVADFRRSVQIESKDVWVWINFGHSLLALNKPIEALDAYQKAAKLAPHHPLIDATIGQVYLMSEDYMRAQPYFERALQKKPDSAALLSNLGCIFTGLKQSDLAICHYEKALALEPESAIIHFNFAVSLTELGQFDRAEQSYRRAIQLDSHLLQAHINLAMLYSNQGKATEALHHFDKARLINAQHPELIFAESFRLLQSGDFQNGWTDYEARLQTLKEHQQRKKPPQPRWEGQSFCGKTLFIQTEQGFGDTLQFIRYLPLVKQRGGRVIVGCQPELLGLLRSCYPTLVDAFISRDSVAPIFDYYIELMSLPYIFQTQVETIPFPEGYLQPLLNESLKTQLKNLSDKPKIGLVWAGNPHFKGDAIRSLPSLALYKPLLENKQVNFCSLQWGKKGTDAIVHENLGDQLIDLSPVMHSFVDTATAVSSMDLIISTDTSIVHLAGALGKKTWVLLCAAPDFRWSLQSNHCDWYKSLRLFHQSTLGDWEGVVGRVNSCLAEAFS